MGVCIAGPAQQRTEATLSYIPIVMVLMLIGMAFSYFILIPYIIQFTFDLSEDMGIETTIGINQYFGFLFRMVIPFGLIFQMPIMVLFLTQLGIITPTFLKKNGKYASFILLVAAALIAPPDLMTHIMITIIYDHTLYEISIYISKIGYRRHLKAEQKAIEESLDAD